MGGIRTDEDLVACAMALAESLLGIKTDLDPRAFSGTRLRGLSGPGLLLVVISGVAQVGRPLIERGAGVAAVGKRRCVVVSLAQYGRPAVQFAESSRVALFRVDYEGKAEPISDDARSMCSPSLVHPEIASPRECDRCGTEWVDLVKEFAEPDELEDCLLKGGPTEVRYEVPGADHNPIVDVLCQDCKASAHMCDVCETFLGPGAPMMERRRLAKSDEEAYNAGHTDILDRGPHLLDVYLCPACDSKLGAQMDRDADAAERHPVQSLDFGRDSEDNAEKEYDANLDDDHDW